MTRIDDFLSATREVARLRWPVPRTMPVPVQRPIGKRNGLDILWPASGASLDELHIVEDEEGARFAINSVERYITSSLESETQACIKIAQNLDWQSRYIREVECQSLEALEHEAASIALANIGDLAFVHECLRPLMPLAARIRSLHREVPASRVNDLVNSVLRREIYPARASVKSEITVVNVEVRFWQNPRFDWLAVRCSIYYEQTIIYPVFISEGGKEYGLNASLSAVTNRLADVVHSPDEAVALLRRLDKLMAWFMEAEDER